MSALCGSHKTQLPRLSLGELMHKNTKNFFHRLNAMLEAAREADRFDLVDSLENTVTFATAGLYVPRGTVNNLDLYLTKSDTEIAHLSGMSVGAITQRRRRYSTALYSALGDDFFDLPLRENGAQEIAKRLSYAIANLDHKPRAENVLPLELIALGKQTEVYNTYNIRDCEYEVRMLAHYSRQGMRSSVTRADIDKLRYLISVLDGESGTIDEQTTLTTAIKNSKGCSC